MFRQKFFESADGQIHGIGSASQISKVTIWEGNRIINTEHVESIKESVKEKVSALNHSPIRLVEIQQENESPIYKIVDGQHRIKVIQNYFNNPESLDFDIMISIKKLNSEEEIVEFFRYLNCVKAINYEEDPKMKTIPFMEKLMYTFNTKQKPLFRPIKTRKPYIYTEAVREKLLVRFKNPNFLKTPQEVVEAAKVKNEELLQALRNKNITTAIEDDMIHLKFALALDEKFSWI
jgi:hypothetical protein